MLKRRVPRVLVSGFVMAVAVSGLTACKTSPNVAAYVGDEQVTVTELENAIERRLESDPDLAAFVAEKPDDYTRSVLTLLVDAEVHAAAAERYGVEVDDDDVRRRIEDVLAGRDPDAEYRSLAQRGIGRADVFESVRQQLVRQEIAEAEGAVEAPTEAELRARYDEVREELAEVSYGYITVPDEATAAAVLAQLTADPASYPAVAAQYPSPTTLTALETAPPGDLPAPLVEGVLAAEPNTGFATPVAEVGGVVVTFVAGREYPSFEDLRPRLEQEVAGAADVAGAELVDAVEKDLGVTLNPRYGVLEEGKVVEGDGGVVDFLDDGGAVPAEPGTPGN